MQKDCTKRNLIYEVKCLTCEDEAIRNAEEEAGDDLEKLRVAKSKIRNHVYYGETHRSAFERGFEHLQDLARLSEKSHMLKHMVYHHEGEDFSQVRFGMKVIRFTRSAFERQVGEAVLIQQERARHQIMNSRAEFSNCSLPRLQTRMGESDLKDLEKEINDERSMEEDFANKVRYLRRKRNGARLTRGHEGDRKRQKTGQGTYISVREVWGAPDRTEAKKMKADDKVSSVRSKKMKVECRDDLKHDNDEQTEQIVEFDDESDDNPGCDWNTKLSEHLETLENDVKAVKEDTESEVEKKSAWELYELCKDYLEDNEKHWQQKKLLRMKEIKKKERLEEARIKKLEWKERYLTKSLIQLKTKLPEDEDEKLLEKEEKDRRIELQRVKKSMYKLRHKEKLYNTNNEYLTRITKLEDKIVAVRDILEKVKNEDEELVKICEAQEEKVTSKKEKEEAKKKKDNILGERWGLMKWITVFIEENSERWAREKLEREKAAKDILAAWDRKTRLLKIKELKMRMMTPSESRNKENIKKKAAEKALGWKVWRMKADIEEEEDEATAEATTDEKSDKNEVTSNVEIVKKDETKEERKEITKDENEAAIDEKIDENEVPSNAENVANGEEKEEVKGAPETGMEGEPGHTRLASHEEENKNTPDKSKRVENPEKKESIPESSKRMDKRKAEKAKAAKIAKIVLIVKIKGRQTAGSKDTQVR